MRLQFRLDRFTQHLALQGSNAVLERPRKAPIQDRAIRGETREAREDNGPSKSDGHANDAGYATGAGSSATEGSPADAK